MKYKLNDYYGKEYYGNKRMGWKETTYKILGETIYKHFKPFRVTDMGCGNGVLSRGFNCPYIGFEGSDEGVKACLERGISCYKFDLRESLTISDKDDLVVSIEVAEHLEEKYAKVFVKNLTMCSDNILITASNEKGYSHFNCQPQSYWIDLFKERKYSYDKEVTDKLRLELSKKILPAYSYLWKNMMIFKKETK